MLVPSRRIWRKLASVIKRFSWAFKDSTYLKIIYWLRVGEKLNLADPSNYNEKLQWLKLFNKEPKYSEMVDKYRVKDYVGNIIGYDHIIPTLGLWDRYTDIDFDMLPSQFVLKTTHDSGGVVICQDKSKYDKKRGCKILTRSLKRNYYSSSKEWPYKDVEPRIIAEKYMVDESGQELKDYKIFAFSGVPKVIQVDYDRFSNHRRNYYDTEWNYLPLAVEYVSDPDFIIEKPAQLDRMLKYSRLLSANIPHVRVDFYSIGTSIYFGELTFFHESGYGKFIPERMNKTFGDWLDLSNISPTRHAQ